MTKVLVSDPIDQAGIDILTQVAQVDQKVGLSPDQLKNIIGEYDGLMIRSGTQVTSDVISEAKKLRIIGRAGVGVDNVDVPTATRKGVLVVNSPGGNTIAAAEHALAMMLALSRNIPQAHASMFSGGWDRKKYVGNELYKKTLGVVGLGKIGSHVAKVANAMGMEVIGFDPFVSNERAQQMQVRLSDIEELFKESDYVTLHLPRTPETENLVDIDLLRKMKPTARLVNCARGGIINENDLVLTPHLGASTVEAQQNVAIDVAEQIRDVLLGLPARSAVNIPGLSAEIMDSLKPHLKLAETLGLLVSQISGGQIQKLEVRLQGEFAQHPSQPLVIATLKGLLTSALGDKINYVNASLEAKGRGIDVVEIKDELSPEFARGSLQLDSFSDKGVHSVSGTVFGNGDLGITSIDEYPINFVPSRHMLFTRHRDMPGIIGQIGSLLGKYNVNIASMQVGRRIVRGEAVMVLSIDDPIPSELLGSILSMQGINEAHAVTL